MLLNLLAFADGHELQRPEQDLSEMADELAGVKREGVRHASRLPWSVGL